MKKLLFLLLAVVFLGVGCIANKFSCSSSDGLANYYWDSDVDESSGNLYEDKFIRCYPNESHIFNRPDYLK